METWFLVIDCVVTLPSKLSIDLKKSTCLLIAIIFTTSGFSQAEARSRQDIRFYKANKILQTDRIRFTKKRASKPGCHNFVKKARVYKAVQFAYSACYLYAEKNCESGSIIEVAKEKDDVSTTVLLEGYGWFPQSDNERGVRVKSWSCTHEPIILTTAEGKLETSDESD